MRRGRGVEKFSGNELHTSRKFNFFYRRMDPYAALALISNPKEKYEAYRKTLIEKIQDDCSSYEASLFPFFAHLTAENANSSILAISRQLLTELGTTTPLPAAHVETILSNCLTQAHKRIVSFEEAIAAMRERLAKHYQEEGEWLKAATCLTLIPLDSGHRLVTDQYKIKTLLDIAYLYLEVEDFVSAESFMNRASVLLGKAGTQADPISQLRQKVREINIILNTIELIIHLYEGCFCSYLGFQEKVYRGQFKVFGTVPS